MRISLRTLLFLISLPLLLIAAAHIQWGVVGLPTVPTPLQTLETLNAARWFSGLAADHPLRQFLVHRATRA